MNYLFNIVLAIIIIILLTIDICMTKSAMRNNDTYFNKQRVMIQKKVPTEDLFIIDEEVL